MTGISRRRERSSRGERGGGKGEGESADLQFSRKMHISSCSVSLRRYRSGRISCWIDEARRDGVRERGRESASIRVSIIWIPTDNSKTEEKWNKNGSLKEPAVCREQRLFPFIVARVGMAGNIKIRKKGWKKIRCLNEKRKEGREKAFIKYREIRLSWGEYEGR